MLTPLLAGLGTPEILIILVVLVLVAGGVVAAIVATTSRSGRTGPLPPQGDGAPAAVGWGQPGYAVAVTSQKAVWSLVLGVVGLLCCGVIAGVVAVVLGKQAQAEIDASGGLRTGRGMASAGFVLGIVAIVLWVLLIAAYVVAYGS